MLPSATPHGREPRGLLNVPRSSISTGRFGRLFRWLPAAEFGSEAEGKAALLALAKTMQQGEFDIDEPETEGKKLDKPITESEPDDENPTIPAGYTYLGQFIDHDITFDPVSTLQAFADPDALTNFRTPRLDLDSVYGRGPDDQPYLYDTDGPMRFLLGPNRSADNVTRPDLARNCQHRALTGDPRNDENLIVAQVHALFQRFHNAVVAYLIHEGRVPHDRLFDEAQRLVRWHYQWIVLHDFLRRVVGEPMAIEVLHGGPGGTPNLRLYHPRSPVAYIPVEFSGAAYRFGHSMVRPSYLLNRATIAPDSRDDERFHRIPIFSDRKEPRANLNGRRNLPDRWGIDWSFFFDYGLGEGDIKIPQPSYRIDTVLVDPLSRLPEFAKGQDQDERRLAFRNLLRGWRLGLPSGQDVACLLGETPLTDERLWTHHETERAAQRWEVYEQHPVFAGRAPLWYYILREAELTRRDGVEGDRDEKTNFERGGHHLGRVGGRIVAEVLVGLVLHDHYSYLFQKPTWQPDFARNGDFTMPNLVAFIEDVEARTRGGQPGPAVAG